MRLPGACFSSALCPVGLMRLLLRTRRAVLLVRLVDDGHVRRDFLLIHEPVEIGTGAVGRIGGKPGRLNAKAILGAFDHRLRCPHLSLPDGARGLDCDDTFEHLPEDGGVAKPFVASAREGRMIRQLVFDAQSAKMG